MRCVTFVSLLGLLAVVACSGVGGRRLDAGLRHSTGVYVLSAQDMWRWCNMVSVDGSRVDPDMCEDFRDPPVEAVAKAEARLPRLLSARGQSATPAEAYVRQYWAAFREGRVYVTGNLVCRSLLVGASSDDATDDPKPMAEHQLAHAPFVVDDAGACNLTVQFPADRPKELELL
jgi:hypothetical protein